MANLEEIHKLILYAETRGLAESQRQLQELANKTGEVTKAVEQEARAYIDLETKLHRNATINDQVTKATRALAQSLKDIERARAAGINVAGQEEAVLAKLAHEYGDAGRAVAGYAAQIQKLIQAEATAGNSRSPLSPANLNSITSQVRASRELSAASVQAAESMKGLSRAATATHEPIRLQGWQLRQLGQQFTDLAVQIGSGQGLFRPLLQQGPQVVDAMGGVSNATLLLRQRWEGLSGVTRGGLIAGGALVGIGAATVAIGSLADALARAATGDAYEKSVQRKRDAAQGFITSLGNLATAAADWSGVARGMTAVNDGVAASWRAIQERVEGAAAAIRSLPTGPVNVGPAGGPQTGNTAPPIALAQNNAAGRYGASLAAGLDREMEVARARLRDAAADVAQSTDFVADRITGMVGPMRGLGGAVESFDDMARGAVGRVNDAVAAGDKGIRFFAGGVEYAGSIAGGAVQPIDALANGVAGLGNTAAQVAANVGHSIQTLANGIQIIRGTGSTAQQQTAGPFGGSGFRAMTFEEQQALNARYEAQRKATAATQEGTRALDSLTVQSVAVGGAVAGAASKFQQAAVAIRLSTSRLSTDLSGGRSAQDTLGGSYGMSAEARQVKDLFETLFGEGGSTGQVRTQGRFTPNGRGVVIDTMYQGQANAQGRAYFEEQRQGAMAALDARRAALADRQGDISTRAIDKQIDALRRANEAFRELRAPEKPSDAVRTVDPSAYNLQSNDAFFYDPASREAFAERAGIDMRSDAQKAYEQQLRQYEQDRSALQIDQATYDANLKQIELLEAQLEAIRAQAEARQANRDAQDMAAEQKAIDLEAKTNPFLNTNIARMMRQPTQGELLAQRTKGASYLGAFAEGFDGIVQGRPGRDANRVVMDLTSRERVTVTPVGKERPRETRPLIINFNVRDGQTILQSRGELMRFAGALAGKA
jgi:hypothetical protein